MTQKQAAAIKALFEACEWDTDQAVICALSIVTSTLAHTDEYTRFKWLDLIIDRLQAYKDSGTANFSDSSSMPKH